MTVQYLSRPGKPRLAYVYSKPRGDGESLPLLVFLGGYRSDMTGTKAKYLEEQSQRRGQAFLRFDYSGHGVSDGNFEDGTIGGWKDDAQDIIQAVGDGRPVVLAGSSMGGWIALLIGVHAPGRVQGLVGIAAAPDFPKEMLARLTPDQRVTYEKAGAVRVPSDYGAPYYFSRAFYDEAQRHALLNRVHTIDFPVRLVQGMHDTAVAWETAPQIQKCLTGAPVDIVFIEDGDHKLSRPEDLALIDREILSICGSLR